MRTIKEIKEDMAAANKIITSHGEMAKVYSGSSQAQVDYAEANLNILALELLAVQSSPAPMRGINFGVISEDGEGGNVSLDSIRDVYLWGMEAQGLVSVTYLTGVHSSAAEALETVGVYRNIKVFTNPRVFLTIDGTPLHEIPAEEAETIVYEIQKKLDEAAVLEGRDYGKLVSTTRLK